MKKKTLFVFSLLATLTSCSLPKEKEGIDRSIAQSLNFKESSFKILQLTDIHFSSSTDIKHESEFISASVSYADPDLIMVTGDSLLNATKGIADALFSMLDSWRTPYYFLFGNHDLQGFYSESWLLRKIYSSEFCLNSYMGATSKCGHSDSVINLKKDDKTIFQVYSFDSHSNVNIDGVYYYDYLREDQIDWYVEEAEKAKERNGGSYIPSLGFLHIPLWESVDAYLNNKEGLLGEIHKKFTYKKIPELTEKMGGPIPFCPGVKNLGFFEKANSRGMKGIFFGHDHDNDWVGEYRGTAIGYGVKTDRELFYGVSNAGYDMIGGAVYTVKDDASYSIKHFFLDYEDYSLTYEKEIERP